MGYGLKVIPNSEEVVEMYTEEMDNVDSVWGYCLIGYFATFYPGNVAVLQLCESWKVQCSYTIHSSVQFEIATGMGL